MQERLACQEGMFLELASVMPFVAVERLTATGVIKAKDSVICLATASGLKDISKSTADWADLPVETGDLEQLVSRTNKALRAAST